MRFQDLLTPILALPRDLQEDVAEALLANLRGETTVGQVTRSASDKSPLASFNQTAVPRSPTVVPLSDINFDTASQFYITYRDQANRQRTYYFSLLPAIESNLRPSQMGAAVPEVKPGILIRTGVNYKRILIPGTEPIYQSLGIEQRLLQLVGCLIGNEGSSRNPVGAVYDPRTRLDAYRSALTLDQDVVRQGNKARITIISQGSQDAPAEISYPVLIQTLRILAARQDRVYYAIDALILRDEKIGPATPDSFIGPVNTTGETAVRISHSPRDTAPARPQNRSSTTPPQPTLPPISSPLNPINPLNPLNPSQILAPVPFSTNRLTP